MRILLYKSTFLIITTALLAPAALSQDKKTVKDYVEVGGYVRHMNSLSFIDLDDILTDNLVHNRINLKAYLADDFSLVGGIRNRIFYGQATSMNPAFGDIIDRDNGMVDMSFVLMDQNAMVIHSMVDRAYLKYTSDKLDIRLGRQRINWGMNLAWNPNDLFNTYTLIDFDYQERAGADAARVQYFFNGQTSFDVACQYGDDLDESIIAGMFKFNRWEYDFQILGGSYYTDIAAGVGWAGNLKNMGLKGEATYFHPKKNYSDTSGVLSSSVTLDYSLKNGLYLNASVLYNGGGSDNATSGMNPFQSFMGTLSAKNLMPSRLTYFLQGSGAFTPALTGSLALFYMDGFKTYFYMPSISYSIQENWELMLLGQVAMGDNGLGIEAIGNGVFLRLMFSY